MLGLKIVFFYCNFECHLLTSIISLFPSLARDYLIVFSIALNCLLPCAVFLCWPSPFPIHNTLLRRDSPAVLSLFPRSQRIRFQPQHFDCYNFQTPKKTAISAKPPYSIVSGRNAEMRPKPLEIRNIGENLQYTLNHEYEIDIDLLKWWSLPLWFLILNEGMAPTAAECGFPGVPMHAVTLWF